MKNSFRIFLFWGLFLGVKAKCSRLEVVFFENRNLDLLEKVLLIEELTASPSEPLDKIFKTNLKLSILSALRGDNVESSRRLQLALSILEKIPQHKTEKDILIDHLNLVISDLREIQSPKEP